MRYSKKPKKGRTKEPDVYDFDPLTKITTQAPEEEACPDSTISNPHNAREYYLRGLLFEKSGDSSRAIADYDKAINLDPRLAWAYYRRALAHGAKGNSAEQSKDLQAAARLGLWMAMDMLTLYSDIGRGDLT